MSVLIFVLLSFSLFKFWLVSLDYVRLFSRVGILHWIKSAEFLVLYGIILEWCNITKDCKEVVNSGNIAYFVCNLVERHCRFMRISHLVDQIFLGILIVWIIKHKVLAYVMKRTVVWYSNVFCLFLFYVFKLQLMFFVLSLDFLFWFSFWF